MRGGMAARSCDTRRGGAISAPDSTALMRVLFKAYMAPPRPAIPPGGVTGPSGTGTARGRRRAVERCPRARRAAQRNEPPAGPLSLLIKQPALLRSALECICSAAVSARDRGKDLFIRDRRAD
ncbi:hypothetical protein SKAU_G00029640 [Synaphobranchus kaupii]|uniref:Uncharacterized protein n=1 Tax=Synaphobranchus kaupii TaxID=118154 RepID=A0A9Q1GDC3_SYNKA|nr:hypothetical protein SKAU_G00029640 [Synaphobranchus kaupii]